MVIQRIAPLASVIWNCRMKTSSSSIHTVAFRDGIVESTDTSATACVACPAPVAVPTSGSASRASQGTTMSRRYVGVRSLGEMSPDHLAGRGAGQIQPHCPAVRHDAVARRLGESIERCPGMCCFISPFDSTSFPVSGFVKLALIVSIFAYAFTTRCTVTSGDWEQERKRRICRGHRKQAAGCRNGTRDSRRCSLPPQFLLSAFRETLHGRGEDCIGSGCSSLALETPPRAWGRRGSFVYLR